MDKVKLKEEFQSLTKYWDPKKLGEVNDLRFIIYKAKGEYKEHYHDDGDEMFFVVKGQLKIKLKDREVILNEGEIFVVPKGVVHLPYAEEEAHVVFFEPKGRCCQ